MLYEQYHLRSADRLQISRGTDFQFPPHIHQAYELICVEEGEMNVLVDGQNYPLTPGKAVLVFPNQVHSFNTPEHSQHILWIFSPEFVRAFNSFSRDHLPLSGAFVLPDGMREALIALSPEDSTVHIKSVLYTLIDLFDRGAEYRLRNNSEDDLLFRIFDFVSTGYNGDCSLKKLSEVTSYHYVYLSRYFTKHTGMSFTAFVNTYRINEGCYRLINTTDSITKIALDCGFESLRSFHRNFRSQMGTSPAEYRVKHESG